VDVLHDRVAGLDVHRQTVVACVRWPGSGRTRRAQTREFDTYVGDLEALRDWLVAEAVTHVAMEATGAAAPGRHGGHGAVLLLPTGSARPDRLGALTRWSVGTALNSGTHRLNAHPVSGASVRLPLFGSVGELVMPDVAARCEGGAPSAFVAWVRVDGTVMR
jgi:hypothetical protein